MTAPLFEIKNLRIEATKPNGRGPIVDDVSLQVERGEVLALIGESGSGKTTLGLTALAYTKPGLSVTFGQVLLDEEDLFAMDGEAKRQLRGSKVAYLAQSAAATFNPALSIDEQVTETAVLHGKMTMAEAKARANALYYALELPDPDTIGRRYPHEVSGGQLQRLMAAMALCSEPDLLVLDEPTTALDVTTQIEVLKSIKRVIKQENAAAIYITHDLTVVAQIADQVLVLRNGREQENAGIEKIVSDPDHAYTKKLIAAASPAVEHKAVQVFDEPVLEVRDMSAGYGAIVDGEPSIPVLRDITLSIHKSETVGIIGESGCGKSTLARAIAGMLPPSKGEVLLTGTALEADRYNRSKDDLRRVQFVFQMADTALNPKQRVRDIIGRPLSYFSGLTGSALNDRVRELLELVDLSATFANRYPTELSGGQKQRINLARALAGGPDIVLCDEVTSALDVVVGASVIKLLNRLKADLGVSFVFICHDLHTVRSFSDRIVVMYAGRIVETAPTEALLQPPFHPYTRLLISSIPEMRTGWLEETIEKQETKTGVGGTVKIIKTGCPFHTRCPQKIAGLCETTNPPNLTVVSGHTVQCHLKLADLPN